MNRKLIFCMLYGGLLLVISVAAYLRGRNEVIIENFKTYNADLISFSGFPETRKVELKDFLKARYYYFANRVPENYLGVPYDYGAVDFQGLTIGKGPTTPQNEYQHFKNKKVQFKEPKVQP